MTFRFRALALLAYIIAGHLTRGRTGGRQDGRQSQLRTVGVRLPRQGPVGVGGGVRRHDVADEAGRVVDASRHTVQGESGDVLRGLMDIRELFRIHRLRGGRGVIDGW